MTDAQRIAELEEQVAQLKERAAWLESELGLTVELEDIDRLKRAFRLTFGQAAILRALYLRHGRTLTQVQVENLSIKRCERHEHSPTYLRVMVCRMRKSMTPQAIKTVGWGGPEAGYALTRLGIEMVDQVLAPARKAAA